MAMINDSNRQWWILAAMGGVMGFLLLDETIVAVALHTISKEFALSQTTSHWVVNAYLLVFTCFAAVAGKLGDVLGYRNLFLLGTGIFGIASFACGIAEDGYFLIAARAFQGIGAAIVFPLSMAMVALTFSREQRGMAFGICAAFGTFFLALGPLIGGLVVHTLSWRWIFWINLPFVTVIGVVVLAAWREPQRTTLREHLDYWGLFSLVGGLTMIVLAVMQGPEWGWLHPAIWVLFATGVLVFALFIAIDRHIPNPLIEVDLFRHGNFSTSVFSIFTAQFTQMAIVLFGALYFQSALHMSPLAAGAALLVAAAPAPILSAPTGRLADKIGARPVAIGALSLTVLGLLWIAVAIGQDSYALVIPGMILWGACNSALYIAPRRAALNAVQSSKQGEVGGILMTGQLLGGTASVAVCGSIFATTTNFHYVFLTSAAVAVTALLCNWLWLEKEPSAADGQSS